MKTFVSLIIAMTTTLVVANKLYPAVDPIPGIRYALPRLPVAGIDEDLLPRVPVDGYAQHTSPRVPVDGYAQHTVPRVLVAGFDDVGALGHRLFGHL